MKKLNYIIAGVFILSVFISCSRKDPSGAMNDPPQEVTAMEVAQKPVVFYETFPGNTVPLKEVDIHGGVAGYITGIYFMEGSPVKQGQKLYEIDRSKYEAAYEEAKANVQIANANLEKVQQDYDRYQQLSKEDAIARQKLDYAEADLRTAKMGLVAAQSELVKTKTDLDYSLITAPFDGTIGISQVKIGTLVTPGQTLLNTISSDDPMGVDVQVNEKELEHFEGFKKNTPIPGDSTFQLVLPNDSIYKYTGTMSIIDRAIDPETGTIRVRLDFPNKDRSLKAGMTCKVRVRNTDKVPQIIIPMKAVTEQMSEYFVFRVNGDKAEQVRINPGQRIGDDIIVSEGLNIGDKIVINGIQKLRNGAQIKVVPEGKTGGQMGQK